jgi:hypothetical protein
MSLTFADMVQTSEDRVTITGDQIPEFAAIVEQATMARVDKEAVLTLIQGAEKIVGYRVGLRHPGNVIGVFAGRRWFAEGKTKPIDWAGDEHGLNNLQLRFAHTILKAVMAEFRGSGDVLVDLDGRITEPEALRRFEYVLITALHAYDTARTERLNFLEAEYRRQIDRTPTPSVVIWPDSPEGQVLSGYLQKRLAELQRADTPQMREQYRRGMMPASILLNEPAIGDPLEEALDARDKAKADDELRKASGMSDDELRAAGYTLDEQTGNYTKEVLINGGLAKAQGEQAKAAGAEGEAKE